MQAGRLRHRVTIQNFTILNRTLLPPKGFSAMLECRDRNILPVNKLLKKQQSIFK